LGLSRWPFSRYYDIAYPGQIGFDCDSDFASGAMENLGAITFVRPLSWSTKGKRRGRSWNGWRMSCPTRTPTCGSAIW
jgi:hypothetical protein